VYKTIYFVILLAAIGLRAEASALGVTIDGACVFGSCPATALAVGNSETDSFNSTITLANGDMFQVFGTFGGINSAAGDFSASHDFQVVYEGNVTGGTSENDTIDVMLLYLFASGGSSSATFDRDVIGAFGPGIAASSSASSCVDMTLGCTGTLTPPGSFNSTSSFGLNSSGGNFTDTPNFVSNFGAGSAVGSYVVWGQSTAIPVPTPEPASVGSVGLGLLTTICVRRLSKCRL
jgi:hypothetical protein